MSRRLLTIIPVLFTLTSIGQSYSRCRTFQYIGVDSLDQKLVSEEIYNSKGQLISYYYKGYKECLACGQDDTKNVNFYNDTLLVLMMSFNEYRGDSSKVIYYYNNSGQKIKEEHFDFKRRLKKGVDKGMGRPGGCVVFDSDFEKDRTWAKTREKIFKYDIKGNKILFKDSNDFYPVKHIWTYDKDNRIVIDSAFLSFDYLNSIDTYQYFQGGYQVTHTWYDSDGSPKHLKEGGNDFWPQYTFAHKLNGKGQIIEQTMTEKGELVSRETTLYDLSGKIKRQIKFDSKGQPEITHVYLYE